jgi:hypothetical protein
MPHRIILRAIGLGHLIRPDSALCESHHANHHVEFWASFLGVVGVAAPMGGFTVSYLPEVEGWLRAISLFVGICVGILAMFYHVIRIKRLMALGLKRVVPPPASSADLEHDSEF